ncbi:MAG TPA: ATP-binding protein [Thermodesulfobacteriota bacterium]|jgi:DNA replication protein DnaC|nr:ATP-binding protein [Thermodesulfobacteriota bacterium]
MVKQASIGCERCHYEGYLVEKRGDFAVAKICDECVKENCPECRGVGSILSRNERGYTYVSTCGVCGVVRRNVKLYNLAGIPAKYSQVLQVDAGFKPKNQSQEYALKYAKEFVKRYPPESDRKKGFLLMGRAGLGKTHLSIGTISELTLQRGVKCLFKDFFYLLSELKEAYSLGTPENEVLFPLIETEVLVIDELGKGKSNEWELNILDQLISKRYNASKVTLITTNYISREIKQDVGDREDILENRVGDRIASRLYEMCEFIYLKGEDHRKARRRI